MLKVVVYDYGWGGELVANYLESELDVIEVIRLIDWHPCPQNIVDLAELKRDAVQALQAYIGKVDLIVLGGYVVAQMAEYLGWYFPTQEFVSVGFSQKTIAKTQLDCKLVAVLCHPLLVQSSFLCELQDSLPYATFAIPDCGGWQELVDRDLMTEEVLRASLSQDFRLAPCALSRTPLLAKRPDLETHVCVAKKTRCQALLLAIERFEKASEEAARDEQQCLRNLARESIDDVQAGDLQPNIVMVLDTHLWGLLPELERIFGWQVKVVAFQEKLLHDVCAALHLRGVHGGRAC